MIKIGIAEDQALVRESLAIVLGLEADVTVCWTAATGTEAVRHAEDTNADVILMDLRMPDMDGVTAIRRITALETGAAILVLTTIQHEEWLIDALQAGAVACFLKEIPPRLLMDAIRRIRENQWEPSLWSEDWRLFAPVIQFQARVGSRVSLSGADTLSARELELLRRICAGDTNGEIALALHLTEGTVKNYVSTLYAKLSVRHRAEAIRVARERGLV
jgi:two-component system, NarL family, response regulator DesR